MKRGILYVLIAGLITISSTYNNQQTSQYFVQFRIITIGENSQAMQVDRKMNNKSGIVNSRTDYITSTYFCLLKPGADYEESDFVNWFDNLGYTISCFHKGIQGVDPVISPHELKDCLDD